MEQQAPQVRDRRPTHGGRAAAAHARSRPQRRPRRSGSRWSAPLAGVGLPVAVAALVAGGPLPAQAAVAAGAGAGAPSAQVYVLQGVAGEVVQVTVDGRTVASAVRSRTVVGPLTVAPGRHSVQLRRGTDVVAQAGFDAAAGASLDLVAHRFPDAARAAAFTSFTNDVSAVAPGRTRLRVVHTAVVPPADIVVNGTVLMSNLANGESATRVVPDGAYQVSIVPTASTGPAVFGPTTLRVGAGTLTNVFAIGDPAAGTMDAIVQALPVRTGNGSGAPSRVETGDGGQAAALLARTGPDPAMVAGLVGAVGCVLVLLATAARRRGVR